MKKRKNILIVDNNCELEHLIRAPLIKFMEDTSVFPILVRAKDGAEAAIKSENQKFDIVLIDTEVPRLMDGGFVYGIHSYKNTQDADVIVVSERDPSELPEPLKKTKVLKRPVSPQHLIDVLIESLNAEPIAKAAPPPSGPSSNQKFAVDVRVINAVIKATTSVIGQFGVTQVKMNKAAHQSPEDALSGEISSVIEIKSVSFQGYLAVSFDKNCYLEVCSAMLMEEQTELNSDNQDAVGEINNIIFGNAKSELANFGVEMTSPSVLLGANQRLSCPSGSAGMQISFETSKGSFYLRVIAVPLAHSAAA